MDYFKFPKNFKKLDERSLFANRILKLIYQKHNGDLKEAIKEGKPFFDEFEIFIDNIYELVEDEIPLYAYARLLEYGAENFGFTEKEFEKAKLKTIAACELYYK